MDQVLRALTRLAAAFPLANVPESTVVLYRSELSDLDDSLLVDTIEDAINHCRKFPPIAELREMYREARRHNLALMSGPGESSSVEAVPMPDYIKAQLAEIGRASKQRSDELEDAG